MSRRRRSSWRRTTDPMHRPLLITVSLFLCLASCTPAHSPDDLTELRELHRLRVEALVSGNQELFSRILSDQYRDREGGKREKLDAIRQTIRGGRLSAVRFGPPDISIRGGTAEISSSYRMRIGMKGKELEVSGEERLLVRKHQDGWRIVGGL